MGNTLIETVTAQDGRGEDFVAQLVISNDLKTLGRGPENETFAGLIGGI